MDEKTCFVDVFFWFFFFFKFCSCWRDVGETLFAFSCGKKKPPLRYARTCASGRQTLTSAPLTVANSSVMAAA